MRVGDSASGTESINSSISKSSDAAVLVSDHLHDSKRSELCSSTTAARPSSGADTGGTKRSNNSISQASDAALQVSDLHDSKRLKICSSTAATRPSSRADTGGTKISNSSISQTSDAAVQVSDLHDSKRFKRCSSIAATTPPLSSNADTSGTKGSNSSISQSSVVLVSDHLHGSKRLKRCSSTAAPTRPSSSTVDASRPKRISGIHDLPESILSEILCRLPSYEYIAQCKCVCKSWCTLLSDLSFIRRFLCLQSDDGKQPPIVSSLINKFGMEFLARISLSSNPLARLFKKLMMVHHLETEPIVLGTYNDLVLCCASSYCQRDYYICNPHTCQWVTLPQPPQLCQYTQVGFICDLPYFQCMEEEKGQLIQINPQYRCRVVRLLLKGHEAAAVNKLKLQIFSSETGEWIESTALLPSPIRHECICPNGKCYPYNGVLYWKVSVNFLIGIDPFMITTRNNSSTRADDDHYTCRFVEFDHPEEPIYFRCLGENRGCLQLVHYNDLDNIFSVWELNEDDVSAESGNKYCLQKRVMTYEPGWELGREMVPGNPRIFFLVLAFDPYNDGTLYVHRGKTAFEGQLLMYNIYTGEWSKGLENSSFRNRLFHPLVRQCWPTPVPKLLPHAN